MHSYNKKECAATKQASKQQTMAASNSLTEADWWGVYNAKLFSDVN